MNIFESTRRISYSPSKRRWFRVMDLIAAILCLNLNSDLNSIWEYGGNSICITLIFITGSLGILFRGDWGTERINIMFKYVSVTKGKCSEILHFELSVLSLYLPHFIDNRCLTVSRMYYRTFSSIAAYSKRLLSFKKN